VPAPLLGFFDPSCACELEIGMDVVVGQPDGGVNIGLTSAADDVNPFVGLSVRY
jgi:hypothetical protein